MQGPTALPTNPHLRYFAFAKKVGRHLALASYYRDTTKETPDGCLSMAASTGVEPVVTLYCGTQLSIARCARLNSRVSAFAILH